MEQPTSRSHFRLPYLYNLRAFLIAYVILGHSALSYSNFDNWYYQQAPIGEPMHTFFAALLGVGNFFVLGLFFFVAGLLTPDSATRLGKGSYFKRRLVQLGVPVGCYFMLTPFLTYWGKAVMTGHPGTAHSFIVYVRGFDTGPTWFLLVLLIYTGAYLLIRTAFPAQGSGRGPFTRHDRLAHHDYCGGHFFCPVRVPARPRYRPRHSYLPVARVCRPLRYWMYRRGAKVVVTPY